MNKEKALVIDLDDTVFEFLPFLCKIHNKMNNTTIDINNIKTWDFSELEYIGKDGKRVTGKDFNKTFIEYEEKRLYTILPVLKYTKHALKSANNFGYKIILLTARDKKYRSETMLSLMGNGLVFDELYFSEDKVKIINELSNKYIIDAFIDDSYDNVIDVYDNCNVNNIFLINMPHNEKLEVDKKILRVDNISDALRVLRLKIKYGII